MPKATDEAAVLDRIGAADRLIDVQAVRALLGVSDRTVWKMLYAGKLPACVRVNRSVRWRLSDVQRFIAVGCDIAAFDRESRKAVAAVR